MTDAGPARPAIARLTAVAAILALACAAVVAAAPGADAAARASTTVRIASVRPASGDLLVAGETAVVRGTTSANVAGERLVLQRERGGRWVGTGASAKVRADGTYRIRFTARGMGDARYRVRFPGTSSKAPSRRIREVAVWRWISLVPYVTGGNLTVGGANVAGLHHDRVLRARGVDGGRPDRGTLALTGRCDGIVVVIGVADASDPGFVAEFAMSLDGEEVLTGASVAAGSSAVVALKTTGVAELGLEASYPDVPGARTGAAVWAQPQALCRARPLQP
ncbi:hypothetical protein [Demequina rhizosphaerae]|uniref:hypothetical protein n=1 Tax=Demequina rhizosphaerae TaxID=1638985 RepID=UPI000780BD62|nr:hypothetical protein [Demequina rhizosphaerae]